jgi:predicted nucleotidyltransferase
VRGQATPLSDVDVAVVVTAGTEDRGALQRRLVTLLERRVQGRRAEVRFLDELPTAVRGRVVSEGVRVLTRDRALTVREEVRARMEYHDFLAFERAELATALRALRSGFAGG